MCGFGQPSSGAGLGTNGAFGSTTAGVSSSSTTNTNCGLFDQARTTNTQSGGLFATSAAQGGGLFGSGQHSQTTTDIFGRPVNQQQQSGGLFGQTQNRSGGLFGTAHTNTGGGLFGNNNNNNQQQSEGLFGNSRQTKNADAFGGHSTPSQGPGLFGRPKTQTHNSACCGGFGTQTSTDNTTTSSRSLFGSSSNQEGIFGNSSNNTADGGPFGCQKPAAATTSGNLFGGGANTTPGFGNTNKTNGYTKSGLFETQTHSTPKCGLFNTASTSNQPATNAFSLNWMAPPNSPSNNHDTARQPTAAVPLNDNLSLLPDGTATKPVQDFIEQEINGSTSCYKHLCFMPVYSTFSAEELRIVDYSSGRRHGSIQTDDTCLAFPKTVSASFGTQATVTADSKLQGLAVDSRDVQIASKDAEIRSLKAKIIILEDQLQRANDKPQFGKPGLDRPSIWSSESEQAGPLKGDPNIPINPDPRTNNSGFDFRRPTLFVQPEPSPKSEGKNVTPTRCAAEPSVAGPSTKDNGNREPSNDPDTTDLRAQLESQSKRMECLESQLTKVTALLEKQSLSTSSAAVAVEEQVVVEPKGKERESEEVQTGTGQSTPAVLVYTPENSPEHEELWNFHEGERIDLTASSCDIKEEDTDNLVEIESTQTVSAIDDARDSHTKDSFIRASRTLELLNLCGRPLSVVEIAAPMGLTILEANDIVEDLLAAKVISVSDGKFSYISPENLR